MASTSDTNPGSATSVTQWELDPQASQVEFTARMRLMFLFKVQVVGHFSDVKGTLHLDEVDHTRSQVTITIGTASLDTKMAARDKHLRAADFFEVEKYPAMTFSSRQIEIVDQMAGHYRVTGALTVRNVTREISLDARSVSPQLAGSKKLTFSLTTVLNRGDFGLNWNGPVQKIADEVNLALTLQFIPL